MQAKLVHALIKIGADLRTAFQLLHGLGIKMPLFFVMELVL